MLYCLNKLFYILFKKILKEKSLICLKNLASQRLQCVETFWMKSHCSIKCDWSLLFENIEFVLITFFCLPALNQTVPIRPMWFNSCDNFFSNRQCKINKVSIIFTCYFFIIDFFQGIFVEWNFGFIFVFAIGIFITESNKNNAFCSSIN